MRRPDSSWLARLLHPATAAIAAVLARGILAMATGAYWHPEYFESETLVRNWLGGHGYTYSFLGTVYRSFHSMLPYDGLTAAVYACTGGSHTAMLVVQWGCAAALCVMVGRLAYRCGGAWVAGGAAWLVALHPGFLAYDAMKLQQFSFDACLVVGFLLAIVRWAETPSHIRACAAGGFTGLLMYERGTMALVFPLVLFWVKRRGRVSWRDWTRQVVAYGIAASLVLAPWMIRNMCVYHRVMPMMTTTGMALWKGNHEGATGTEYTADGRSILAQAPAGLEGASELQQMELFHAEAMRFLRHHPVAAWQLYWRKLGYFWWMSPHAGLTYPRLWLVVYQLWYVLMCGAALAGTWAMRKDAAQRGLAQLMWIVGIGFSVGQAIFYIAGRHRWTIEPVLLMLAAVGIARGLAWSSEAQRPLSATG